MTYASYWATRCHHEAKLHEENSFLTLSYSDDKLPADHGLSLREFQLFVKRLREHLSPKLIRYFACGEYAPTTLRPHYHAIIFGHAFYEDRKHHRNTQAGYPIYKSPLLNEIWGLGYAWIGNVNKQSAGYVARYALKKSTVGPDDGTRINVHTGEVYRVEREFQTMSRMPGIGTEWFAKYGSDAFPSDFVIIDGQKHPVPPFYRKLLNRGHDGERIDKLPSFRVDTTRSLNARKRPTDSTERRLVKDEINHRRGKLLPRRDDTNDP